MGYHQPLSKPERLCAAIVKQCLGNARIPWGSTGRFLSEAELAELAKLIEHGEAAIPNAYWLWTIIRTGHLFASLCQLHHYLQSTICRGRNTKLGAFAHDVAIEEVDLARLTPRQVLRGG